MTGILSRSVDPAGAPVLDAKRARIIRGFIRALEILDEGETAGHSRRVVRYVLRLAEEHCRLTGETVDADDLAIGALLHDIGKISVPVAILKKPGMLTDAEMAVMQTHPELGARKIRDFAPLLDAALPVVLCHHERWDGRGYPYGVSGEDIPLAARLFSVVDTFDAITSDRCYRKAADYMMARRAIQRGSGGQFDPACVEAFCAVGPEEWSELRELGSVALDMAVVKFPDGR